MKNLKINGTSVCIIDSWLKTLEKYIKNDNLYVDEVGSALEQNYHNPYNEDTDIIFMNWKIRNILVMLDNALPNLFCPSFLNNEFRYLVIEREHKESHSDDIKNVASQMKELIAQFSQW